MENTSGREHCLSSFHGSLAALPEEPPALSRGQEPPAAWGDQGHPLPIPGLSSSDHLRLGWRAPSSPRLSWHWPELAKEKTAAIMAHAINELLISSLVCNCCCQIQLVSAQVPFPGGWPGRGTQGEEGDECLKL